MKTYEITLGPKNREHTTITFDADSMIHAAQIYCEALEQWIPLADEQVEKLGEKSWIQSEITEFFYQLNESRSAV